MSQLERIKESKKPRVNGNGKQLRPGGMYTTFWPTKADKEVVKSGHPTLEGALSVLQEHLVMGRKISIYVREGTDNLCLTIRHGDYQDNRSVGVGFWHNNVETLIRLAGYYLLEISPEFPNGVQLELTGEFDF